MQYGGNLRFQLAKSLAKPLDFQSRLANVVLFGLFRHRPAPRDECTQVRRDFVAFQDGADLVRLRVGGDVAALVGVGQVRPEAAVAQSRVNLEADEEELIRYGVRALAPDDAPIRFRQAGAQVGQQDLKAVLLFAPGEVVGGPVLRVSRSLGNFIRVNLRPLLAASALADDPGRQDVLAFTLPQKPVFA